MKKLLLISLLGAILLAGCTVLKPAEHMIDGDGMERTYQSVSGEQAMKMMQSGDDYVILDVRARAEFDSEHIPGAMSLPNEQIGDGEIGLLPDRNRQIYIYGRTGEQAKDAAQKLLEKGYNRIVEFGTISDWPGHVVVEEYQAMRPKLILDGCEPGTANGHTVRITDYQDGKLTAELSNASGERWDYFGTFKLSVRDGEAWNPIPWPEDWAWPECLYLLEDGRSMHYVFDVTPLGSLDSGEYLLQTDFMYTGCIETTFRLVYTE